MSAHAHAVEELDLKNLKVSPKASWLNHQSSVVSSQFSRAASWAAVFPFFASRI